MPRILHPGAPDARKETAALEVTLAFEHVVVTDASKREEKRHETVKTAVAKLPVTAYRRPRR